MGLGSTLLGGERLDGGKKTVSGFTWYKTHGLILSLWHPDQQGRIQTRRGGGLIFRSNPRRVYILMETNKLSLLPEEKDGRGTLSRPRSSEHGGLGMELVFVYGLAQYTMRYKRREVGRGTS